MNVEPLTLTVECESCKKRFPITQEQASNSITHKKEFIVKGEKIFLTYYDCPECGYRHFVQIDDETSMQELTRVKIEFGKLAAKRRKGKEISKRQSEKFKNSRQHLSEYRRNLMTKFTGESIIDSNGEVYYLRFSV